MIPDVKGSEYKLEVAADEPTASLAYTTVVPNYAQKLGKRMFVPVNKFNAFTFTPEKQERRNNIYNKFGKFLVDTVRIEFPKGMEVEALGDEAIELKHAGGEYRAEIKVDGQEIYWTRTLKVLPVNLPPEEYPEYRDFWVAVSKAEGRKVVLRQAKTK